MRSKLLIVILFICIIQVNVFASDTDYYIRVGLNSKFSYFDNLDIEDSSLTVGYKLEGNSKGVFASDKRGATFHSLKNPSINKDNLYYFKLDTSFSTFEEAVEYSAILVDIGLQAKPAITNTEEYTVVIGAYTDENALNSDLFVIEETDNEGTSNEDNKIENVDYLTYLENGKVIQGDFYNFSDDSVVKLVFANEGLAPQVRNSDFSPITISVNYTNTSGNNSSAQGIYRGIVELARNANGSLMAINLVKFEEYLYGVVPAEMPSSWHEEALKAQAVAVRNYAYTSETHTGVGYDICDTTHCQVYGGHSSENSRVTSAINDTAGKMAYYNGNLIRTFFYSSSGGSTANSEDVWSEVLPYARAVDDTYETEGKVWSRTYTRDNLTEAANTYGQNIGEVLTVEITKSDSFGRAIDLTFTGTKGSFVVSKDRIRSFFSNYDSSLDSTLFTITKPLSSDDTGSVSSSTSVVNVINKDNGTFEITFESVYVLSSSGVTLFDDSVLFALGANGQYTTIDLQGATDTSGVNGSETMVIDGSGWGHGVGMSQYGAKGMAEAGYNYEEILKHYYTGVDIY
ncbi:MAG: SpoIID/LytB domain-containing protein [Lachnospirales bacterium]